LPEGQPPKIDWPDFNAASEPGAGYGLTRVLPS
jgi:hypothetical protein